MIGAVEQYCVRYQLKLQIQTLLYFNNFYFIRSPSSCLAQAGVTVRFLWPRGSAGLPGKVKKQNLRAQACEPSGSINAKNCKWFCF